MNQHPTTEFITTLIQEGEFFKLKEALKDFEPGELVGLIEEEEEREQLIIFRLLPLELATQVFEYLDLETQAPLSGEPGAGQDYRHSQRDVARRPDGPPGIPCPMSWCGS